MTQRIALIFITLCSYAYSGSSEEETAAFKKFEAVSSWSDLNNAYCRYKAYDDGFIAESISQKIVYLTINNFDELKNYWQVNKDKDFFTFVFNHLDETMSYDDFNNVKKVHNDKCLLDRSIVCKEFTSAINRLNKISK